MVRLPDGSDWSTWREQPWCKNRRKDELVTEDVVRAAIEALPPDRLHKKGNIELRWTLHKNAEERRKNSPPIPKNLDPHIKAEEARMEEQRCQIREEIRTKKILYAESYSDVPDIKKQALEMQKTIDAMAQASSIVPPPKLMVHTPNSSSAMGKWEHIVAGVTLPEFIEINQFSMKHYLTHRDEFRKTMAHELGHIANGDRSALGRVMFKLTPPNQLREALAYCKGAIIYGNPKEYAIIDSKEVYEAKTPLPQNIGDHRYKSSGGFAYLLHRWADILEGQGATDMEGNVTNMKKAVDAFDRLKGVLEDSLKMHQAMHPPGRT
jgi:hypothetical protein